MTFGIHQPRIGAMRYPQLISAIVDSGTEKEKKQATKKKENDDLFKTNTIINLFKTRIKDPVTDNSTKDPNIDYYNLDLFPYLQQISLNINQCLNIQIPTIFKLLGGIVRSSLKSISNESEQEIFVVAGSFLRNGLFKGHVGSSLKQFFNLLQILLSMCHYETCQCVLISG